MRVYRDFEMEAINMMGNTHCLFFWKTTPNKKRMLYNFVREVAGKRRGHFKMLVIMKRSLY